MVVTIIIHHDYLDGETIRMDGALRMARRGRMVRGQIALLSRAV